MSATEHETRRKTRESFAEGLGEFNSQRSWYSARAGDFKKKAQRIDMAIILCGALVAAIPIFKAGGAPHWTEILVSFLGAAVVIGQGAQRIYRYGEIWPEYRLASERMKREWRMFINDADPYSGADDVAGRRYVARLEEVIAEEQKIFFDQQRSEVESREDKG